jgi:peptide/nickel transport system substrate-binding protein
VPDQDAELLRLQSGDIDMTQSELRPDDYVAARRAEDQGRLKIVELGVGVDADAFWFRLKPEAWKNDPRFAFVSKPEFRHAISHAVDREAFAENVFLGAAVPVWGPITPGNRMWFSPNVPRYPHDVNKAKEILKGIGLEDRNGNGVVEDARGNEARFTVITQRGIGWYERGTTELRNRLAQAGIALEIAPIDNGALIQRLLSSDYEAMYYRPLSDIDPAGNMDFWMSSGSGHFWNLEEKTPATEWEARIDALMAEQTSTVDPERRKAIFNDVQRIFAENLPALYFVAPRIYYAHNARVLGVTPSVQRPPALWSADTIAVRGGGP